MSLLDLSKKIDAIVKTQMQNNMRIDGRKQKIARLVSYTIESGEFSFEN